jgi:hypothetical protein
MMQGAGGPVAGNEWEGCRRGIWGAFTEFACRLNEVHVFQKNHKTTDKWLHPHYEPESIFCEKLSFY